MCARPISTAPPPRNVTPYHQTVEDNIAPDIIAALEKKADYRARRAAVAAFNAKNAVLKRGLALTPVKFGISFTTTHLNQAGALVHVYADGSVHLNHGGTEMGQGLMTKVAQVVAEEFSDRSRGREDHRHDDRQGAQHLRHRGLGGRRPQRHGGAGRGAHDQGAAGRLRRRPSSNARRTRWSSATTACRPATHSMRFAELARAAHMARISLSSTGFYRTPKIHYDRPQHRGRPFFYFAYGAAVSEVVIDTLTGENRVLRVDILHDVGRSLNPAIDLGQIEGGFIQGMGWLTTEELVVRRQGRAADPRALDLQDSDLRRPARRSSTWSCGAAENREDTVHRSKAVGEPPLMLAISVFSALTDAVASVARSQASRPTSTRPPRPERILMAVRRSCGARP